jgi:hypothetical protein
LINENILGKCFRSCSSLTNPRISPLTVKYEYPQLSLLIITSVRNQQNSTEVLSHYSMLMYSSGDACFKHSNFFTVKDARPDAGPVKAGAFRARRARSRRTAVRRAQRPAPEIQLRAF